MNSIHFISRKLGAVTTSTASESMSDVPDGITQENAKVVIFYPTLITLIAIEHINGLTGRAALEKRPYIKEVRAINKAKNEYLSRTLSGVVGEDRELLMDTVDSICNLADKSFETLRKVVQKEILKKHPDTDEGMRVILTNGIIAVLLLRTAVNISKVCERQVESRSTEGTSPVLVDLYSLEIINQCINIVAPYQIPYTASMTKSLKAIVRKAGNELKRRIDKKQI